MDHMMQMPVFTMTQRTLNYRHVNCIHMYSHWYVVYTNIDLTFMNSLHGLLNYEIGELDCHIITTEYRTRVHCIHMLQLFCNAGIHVIYSGVSGQWFHTIEYNCRY